MITRILKISENMAVHGSDVKIFEEAGQMLKNGALVAFPTDTVYGLGAIYDDKAAIAAIFQAKTRDIGKPLSILISDISQVDELARDVPSKARLLMQAFWPGALTIILKKSNRVPDCVTAGRDTVGLRMPDDARCRALIAAAGSPLAAPSANISGRRSAASFNDVMEDLNGRVDAIMDGGDCSSGISSTVVDLSGEGMKILREGTVTAEEILAVCGVRCRAAAEFTRADIRHLGDSEKLCFEPDHAPRVGG